MESLQVGMPEIGSAAPGGHQGAAGEWSAADQGTAGDQRDHQEREESHQRGAGQQPPAEAVVHEQRIVFGGIDGGVVSAGRVRLGLRGSRDDELSDAAYRVPGGQVSLHPAVGGPPAPAPAGPRADRAGGRRRMLIRRNGGRSTEEAAAASSSAAVSRLARRKKVILSRDTNTLPPTAAVICAKGRLPSRGSRPLRRSTT